MQAIVPENELKERARRFREELDRKDPGWELALVTSRVNLYYFTGTIQDGILVFPRDGEPVFWVRRSYPRAVDESRFADIRPMQSYRTAAEALGTLPKTIHGETENLTLATSQRLQKHFAFGRVEGIDSVIGRIRSVKSPYEIRLMERAGAIHKTVLEDRVPEILREGMSEADFSTELYSVMMGEGHHGLVRFGMLDVVIAHGLANFGESSIYPTFLDSPGGNAGLPAVPLIGSRDRKLRRGDLVFCDIGCGYHGYHTDKTMTYVFSGTLPDEAVRIHRQCIDILDAVLPLIKPGAIPSEIYRTVTEGLEPAFLENFMGCGERKVHFLGHGIGLEIAENPVIARGFDEPLLEGMVLAVEPKKGIPGIGMVGTENTYLVTPEGGRSITGNHTGLLPVG
jgi:Xaa-Pro aminopeptidase